MKMLLWAKMSFAMGIKFVGSFKEYDENQNIKD